MTFTSGAAITVGSTFVSCALALQVERSAHQFFFWAAPHWYARVDQAYGLTEEDLQYARQMGQLHDVRLVGNLARHACFRETRVVAANHNIGAAPETIHPTDTATTAASTPPRFWNQVRIPSDEERILDSAPL